MKYLVRIYPCAIADIERNADWWSQNHSSEQAIDWYERALDAIYSLESMPTRHATSVENDAFPFEIHDLLFGLGARPSYRAVFTIKGDVVHVLSVRSSSQDTIEPADIAGQNVDF